MSDKDAQSISRGERSNLLARNAANGVVEGVASIGCCERNAANGVVEGVAILDEERGETDVSERSRARTSTSRGCLASVALMACAVGAGMAVASRGGSTTRGRAHELAAVGNRRSGSVERRECGRIS